MALVDTDGAGLLSMLVDHDFCSIVGGGPCAAPTDDTAATGDNRDDIGADDWAATGGGPVRGGPCAAPVRAGDWAATGGGPYTNGVGDDDDGNDDTDDTGSPDTIPCATYGTVAWRIQATVV